MADYSDSAWKTLLGGFGQEGASLQIQLRQSLVSAIESGRIPVGTRLPATRRLADLLGISRNTVIAAVRALTETGYLESRARSGVYVAGRTLPVASPSSSEKEGLAWPHPPALRPSLYRYIEKPSNWSSYPFPFLYGQVDPELFPTAEWRESVRAASSVNEIRRWSSDRIDEDDPDLCRELRTRILPARGIWAAEDELMVTMGAQQALYLIAQLFLSGGRTVGIEDPGYPDMRLIARLFTRAVEYLPVDDQGAVPGPGLMRCDAVFLTCSSQCPTTVPMSETRRRQFLDAAARSGTVIVEDDYTSDLPGRESPRALKSMDRTGNVIHVGSLSKMLAPGLRIGYVVGPADIMTELRALRRLMLRHPPANNQRTMAAFLSLGHYQAYMTRLSASLSERREACAAALSQHLPQVTWQQAPGTAGFWLTLPDGINGTDLVEEARRDGVLIEPGAIFFADPDAGQRHVRLGVGAIPAQRITEGITRLAAALDRVARFETRPPD